MERRNFAILAFFDRALRMESRVWGTYAGRMTAGIFVLFALMRVQQTSRIMGAPGLYFFRSIATINFFLITGMFGYFASAITEEKEDGTMGFLKMTGLSPVSILLGKSATRWFGAMLLLLAQAPFTMLAIVLGGVTPGQIVAVYVALFAYLFAVGNLGLFCSVLCNRSQSAGYLTLFLLGTFFSLPVLWIGAVRAALQENGWLRDPSFWDGCFSLMTNASPLNRIEKIMTTGFASSPFSYPVASNLVLGLLFFAFSWRCFDRFTQEQTDGAPVRFAPVARKSRRTWFSPGRVWDGRALAWKEFYFCAGGFSGMLIRFGVYAFLIWFFAALWNSNAVGHSWKPTREELGAAAMIVSLFLCYLEAIGMAVGLFGPEVKWKTLSTILMLPISTRQLVGQKVRGHLRRLIPCLVYFCMGALLAPQNLIEAIDPVIQKGNSLMVLFMICLLLALLLVSVSYGSLSGRKKISGWMSLIVILGVYLVIFLLGFLFAVGGPIVGGTVVCLILGGITVILVRSFEVRLFRAAAEN